MGVRWRYLSMQCVGSFFFLPFSPSSFPPFFSLVRATVKLRRTPSRADALNEIGGRRSAGSALPALVATRTYAASPFGGESAVYFGGYDCNDVLAPTDTACVFRGSGSTVLTPLM